MERNALKIKPVAKNWKRPTWQLFWNYLLVQDPWITKIVEHRSMDRGHQKISEGVLNVTSKIVFDLGELGERVPLLGP